jgi:hypothetical protein
MDDITRRGEPRDPGRGRGLRLLPLLLLGLTPLGCESEPLSRPTIIDPARDPGQGYLLIGVLGRGRVRGTAPDDQIDCGERCFGTYPLGTTVQLEVEAEEGWLFRRFEGDFACVTGRIVVGPELRCYARFERDESERYALELEVRGQGIVSIDSLSHRPGCTRSCVHSFVKGSTITLSAVGFPGYRFARFEGGEDCARRVLPMDRHRRCVGVFSVDPEQLVDVMLEPRGHGSISLDSPEHAICTTPCLRSVVPDGEIALVARADTERGGVFSHFEGDADCSDGLITPTPGLRCIAVFRDGLARLNLYTIGGPVAVRWQGPNGDRGEVVCDTGGGRSDRGCVVPLRPDAVVRLDPLDDRPARLRLEGDCERGPFTMGQDRSCTIWSWPAPPGDCTGTAPPPAAAQLRASPIACDGVALSWRIPPTDGCTLDRWEIRRDGRWVGEVAGSTPSFSESHWNLRDGVSFRYTVVGVGADGRTGPEAEAVVTTPRCVDIPSALDVKVLLVAFPDKARGLLDPMAASRQVFGAAQTFESYMREMSGGRISLRGEVRGWFALPNDSSGYCANSEPGQPPPKNCDLHAIFRDVARVADPLVDFSGIDRVIVVLQKIGDWAGVAGGAMQTEEGPFAPMIGIDAVTGFTVSTLAQELGHTYRALHASRWQCPTGAPFPDHRSPNSGGCTIETYGDPLDSMGGGHGWFSATHLQRMRLLPPDTSVEVPDDGQFELEPLERVESATRQLEVPLSADAGTRGDRYAIEFRRPIGWDRLGRLGSFEGVVVRLALGHDVSDSSSTLLPPGWNPRPLNPFWDSRSGVRIDVLDVGEERATVTVRRGVFLPR